MGAAVLAHPVVEADLVETQMTAVIVDPEDVEEGADVAAEDEEDLVGQIMTVVLEDLVVVLAPVEMEVVLVIVAAMVDLAQAVGVAVAALVMMVVETVLVILTEVEAEDVVEEGGGGGEEEVLVVVMEMQPVELVLAVMTATLTLMEKKLDLFTTLILTDHLQ